MRIPKRTLLVALSGLAILSIAVAAFAVFHVSGAKAASGVSRTVPLAGTTSPQSGDFSPSGNASDANQDELPQGGEADEGPDPFTGTISFSTGAGGGVSVNSGQKAKSNPTF